MKENVTLKFGKYKGKNIDDVPSSYLLWSIENNTLKGKALLFAKIKIDYPKNKYKVSVEDSVNQKDGVYYVEAYTQNTARRICLRENNIMCSQSMHGTSISTELL